MKLTRGAITEGAIGTIRDRLLGFESIADINARVEATAAVIAGGR